jgi:hypothetical protein
VLLGNPGTAGFPIRQRSRARRWGPLRGHPLPTQSPTHFDKLRRRGTLVFMSDDEPSPVIYEWPIEAEGHRWSCALHEDGDKSITPCAGCGRNIRRRSLSARVYSRRVKVRTAAERLRAGPLSLRRGAGAFAPPPAGAISRVAAVGAGSEGISMSTDNFWAGAGAAVRPLAAPTTAESEVPDLTLRAACECRRCHR